MSHKRPRTATVGPRSICHWTTDDDDQGFGASSASSRQQSTLDAFFATTGSPILQRKSNSSKRRAIPTTPCLSQTLPTIITHPLPTVSPLLSNPSVKTIPLPPQKKQWKQVYLDCGQSAFGQQLCELCGMLYMPGVMEDTKAHVAMCKERCLGVVWRQASGQRVHFVQDKGDSIVSLVLSKSNKVLPAALESVYSHVAQDLGMDETMANSKLVGHHIWLYLRNHRVIGFVATKPISNAFYLVACPNNDEITSGKDENDKSNIGDRDLRLTNAERVMTKAILGIAIMWTHSKFRNQGIATTLIDTARHHAFFGMTVPTKKMAFSSPTHAGWTFGKKYCGNPLIYEYCDAKSKKTDPGNSHTSNNG